MAIQTEQFSQVLSLQGDALSSYGFQPQPDDKPARIYPPPVKSGLFQAPVKVGGAADILPVRHAYVTVRLVKLPGLLCIGRVNFAMVIQELGQPIVLFAVGFDSVNDNLWLSPRPR